MDVRDQLLDAAVRVVSQHGVRGATTRLIAETAGVNEVTLFRQFRSKDELIRQAMCRNAERAPLPTLPDEPSDPRSELLTWATQHYAHLLENRGHIRHTIGEIDRDPDVAAWQRRVPRDLSVDLRRYVERLRDLGRAKGDWDSKAAVWLLMGALFADAISRDIVPDDLVVPVDDLPRRYVELFLNAIGVS